MKILNNNRLEEKCGINVFHGINTVDVNSQIIDSEKERLATNFKISENYISPINLYKEQFNFDLANRESILINFKSNYSKNYHFPLDKKYLTHKVKLDSGITNLKDIKVPDLNMFLGLLYKVETDVNKENLVQSSYFDLYERKHKIHGKTFANFRSEDYDITKADSIMSFNSSYFLKSISPSDNSNKQEGYIITSYYDIKNLFIEQGIAYKSLKINNTKSANVIQNTSLTSFSKDGGSRYILPTSGPNNRYLDFFNKKLSSNPNLFNQSLSTEFQHEFAKYDIKYSTSILNQYLKKYFVFKFLNARNLNTSDLNLSLELNKFNWDEFINNNLTFLTLEREFRRLHISNIQKEIILYFAKTKSVFTRTQFLDYMFAFVFLLNEKIQKGESYIEDLKSLPEQELRNKSFIIRSLFYYKFKLKNIKIKDLLSYKLLQLPIIKSGQQDRVKYFNLINLREMLDDDNVKFYVDKLYKTMFFCRDVSSRVNQINNFDYKSENPFLQYNSNLEDILIEELNSLFSLQEV